MIGKFNWLIGLACLMALAFCLSATCGARGATATPLSGLLGNAGDFNGVSADISGSTLIVGGYYGGNDNTKGWAQIFTQDAGVWTHQAILASDDPTLANGEQFGYAVAIDGDTAVVGSFKNNTVYVFSRSGGAWSENASARIQCPTSSDFGIDVDISGGRILVGASKSNAAYFFSSVGKTWDDRVLLPVAGSKSKFGQSVALAGDVAVVGNPGYNKAHFYSLAGSTWTEEAVFQRGLGEDGFGARVDLDGQRAVVGAGQMDVSGMTDAGSAVIYGLQGGDWGEEAVLTASNGVSGARFGASVAISGDRVVIGAPKVGPYGNQTGAAYVFQDFGDGDWSELAHFFPSDGLNGDEFGQSVAMTATEAVLGAWKHDSDSYADKGAAYTIDLASIQRMPGDANLDGFVNKADAAILADHWLAGSGASWCDGDFNNDGAVNDLDASILAAHWLYSTPAAAVPEPAALVLLLGLVAAIFLTRGRRSIR